MDEHGSGDPGEVVGQVVAVQGATLSGRLAAGDGAPAVPMVIGDLVAIPTGAGRAFGVVHGLRKGRRVEDRPAVEVQLLGDLQDRQSRRVFRRGVSGYPALDAPIFRATDLETRLVYAQPRGASIEVGQLRHDRNLPAHLAIDGLLGKNLAILGSTGSGKSCAVSVLLQALLDACPYAHVLVIDPHNEYAAALGSRALRLDPSNLELPYWLLTFDEIAVVLTSTDSGRAYAEGAILKDAILRAKHLYLGATAETAHITVDTPVPYRLADLARVIESGDGHFEQTRGCGRLSPSPGTVGAACARIAATASCSSRSILRDNLDAILGRLLRLPVDGQPATVLDISGVPSEVVNVVVSLLCG